MIQIKFMKYYKEIKLVRIIIKYNNIVKKYVDVKDDYNRLKFILNEKMKKCEVLLDERTKLKDAEEGKKIMERKKIEKKIESLLEDIKLDMKEMEKELKHQKNNPKKYMDVETKSQILDFINKKI